ncbi:complex I subunit 4 family protein [Desulfoluna spongiiphila]|uniref:NADH dehydrogenase subunit M n=1 Tax=Desulfoluna spongiiphila TaxID=419481 RepID=A0A1G5GEC8_9BACT|nr:NADH-quinone oxidoreductase subunit M [Desulfoluna spongiiphila]SCY49942.1 NADH dehydrogenase subunit M [Desulfoluna spongiiphila]VVS93604.1 nadh:quinone oxidoreductase/mrp antiporter membrane subunit [Desulfoluna spongiiphila]
MDTYLIANTLGYPVLSTLVLLPLMGGLVTFFLKGEKVLKGWGLVVTTATAVLSLPLYTAFQHGTALYQFAEVSHWFPFLDLSYVVGVDGISVLLVLLTSLIMPLCVLCSWTYITERHKEFICVILFMEASMIGVFVSLNLVLFFIFWEAMLVPMYLLIAVWGGERRDYASIKFFLYTLLGSVFLLVSIAVLYIRCGTFFIPDLMAVVFPFGFQVWIFLAFTLAFAIKIPMFPLHTWLPAAHVEAPVAGSVILASILLKMGGYGFLRFCLPMAPAATLYFVPWLIGLSLISIVAGGYLALGQSDVKKLIAYSSVGHMGFVTLGIFLLTAGGLRGAMLQMINHGIVTGALFILVGIIYERTHSREIEDNKALGMLMPAYVTYLVLFSLASFGFPGTNSFVGEFLVLVSAFAASNTVGIIAILGAILAAAYMLRLVQKMVWADSDGHAHGGDDPGHALWDLNLREFVTLGFLLIFVFWIGLNPKPLIRVMEPTLAHLLEQVDEGRELPHGTLHSLLEPGRCMDGAQP